MSCLLVKAERKEAHAWELTPNAMVQVYCADRVAKLHNLNTFCLEVQLTGYHMYMSLANYSIYCTQQYFVFYVCDNN